MGQYYPSFLLILLGLLVFACSVAAGIASEAGSLISAITNTETESKKSKVSWLAVFLVIGLSIFFYGLVQLVCLIFGIRVSFGNVV